MLQAGFHIKDHHIIPVNYKVVDDSFQHDMLRTDTSASACSTVPRTRSLRHCRPCRSCPEYRLPSDSVYKTDSAVGSGTLLYQLTHSWKWERWNPEFPHQIQEPVPGLHPGQHLLQGPFSLHLHKSGKCCRKSCLSYSAFTGYCYFHKLIAPFLTDQIPRASRFLFDSLDHKIA